MPEFNQAGPKVVLVPSGQTISPVFSSSSSACRRIFQKFSIILYELDFVPLKRLAPKVLCFLGRIPHIKYVTWWILFIKIIYLLCKLLIFLIQLNSLLNYLCLVFGFTLRRVRRRRSGGCRTFLRAAERLVFVADGADACADGVEIVLLCVRTSATSPIPLRAIGKSCCSRSGVWGTDEAASSTHCLTSSRLRRPAATTAAERSTSAPRR